MPALKHKGECQIKLGSLTLDLKFKTENLWALTEITGKNPFELFGKLDGLKGEGLAAQIGAMCDLALIVPVIMAGLSSHPDYRKVSTAQLREKVCKLLDAEAVASGTPLFQTVAALGAKLLPEVTRAWGLQKDEDESPNEQAPEAETEAAGA